MPSDEELYDRFRGGEAAALGEVYERHKAGLCAFAQSLLGSRGEAEDILHEVFSRVLAKPEAFSSGSVKSFLYTSCRNACFDRKRRWKVRDKVAGDENSPLRPKGDDHASGEERRPIESDELSALTEALAELPEEQREVIMLHVYSDMSFREIGDVTGVGRDTAASRYGYGLKKLRGLLARFKV